MFYLSMHVLYCALRVEFCMMVLGCMLVPFHMYSYYRCTTFNLLDVLCLVIDTDRSRVVGLTRR
jgi:hypothetical protein